MNQGLIKIRRALISVSDKTGIVEFVRELRRFRRHAVKASQHNETGEAGIDGLWLRLRCGTAIRRRVDNGIFFFHKYPRIN